MLKFGPFSGLFDYLARIRVFARNVGSTGSSDCCLLSTIVFYCCLLLCITALLCSVKFLVPKLINQLMT